MGAFSVLLIKLNELQSRSNQDLFLTCDLPKIQGFLESDTEFQRWGALQMLSMPATPDPYHLDDSRLTLEDFPKSEIPHLIQILIRQSLFCTNIEVKEKLGRVVLRFLQSKTQHRTEVHRIMR